MNEQELNQKFAEYEQKIMQLQDQLSSIERAILDMTTISNGLDELKGKVGEEIYASIGKGIFVKAKLLSEELLVDIGGAFVDKSVSQTKELISDQQDKLKIAQKKIDKDLESINEEITQLMSNFQKEKQKE